MSVELKLTAGNATEQRILDYLLANASAVLAEKINAGAKTLAGALRYCQDEARKLKGSGNCVCVDDATVFGWVIHYFEDVKLDEEEAKEDEVQHPRKPAAKEKSKKPAGRPRKARKPADPADAPAADPETPAEAPQPAQEAATAAPEAKPGPKPAAPAGDVLPLFAAVLNGGQG